MNILSLEAAKYHVIYQPLRLQQHINMEIIFHYKELTRNFTEGIHSYSKSLNKLRESELFTKIAMDHTKFSSIE